MDFNINEKQVAQSFNRIAHLLLLQKALLVNNQKYQITEIEFYYYCKSHPDVFTQCHDYPVGRWRFHHQGLDITLRGGSGFGGILLRGLRCGEKYINGPRKVMRTIFGGLNPVGQSHNEFGLVVDEKRNPSIFKTYRKGLKLPNKRLSCENPEPFKEAKYRFIVHPQKFSKPLLAGSNKSGLDWCKKAESLKEVGYSLAKY